ncbi:MAG: hypothetical protein O7E52_19045 [Candidatus Poribacteria bacterium]|nr:hypothetical protein [Candidatus Poribacteria bacterium]
MYWTAKERIHRAEIDGGSAETFLSVMLLEPRGIAIDTVGRKIYWTDRGREKIQRANMDGTAIEDLVAGWHEDCSHRGTRWQP